MKLEIGKYYRTRDGRKVGPIEVGVRGLLTGRGCEMCHYTTDGKVAPLFLGRDLIAEWTDEPQTGTLAELNVKPGDVVEWIGYEDIGHLRADYLHNGNMIFKAAGDNPYCFEDSDNFRIISRASQSPVRTVTRKEIVPGVYGKVSVLRSDGWWFAFTDNGDQVAHVKLTSDDLTAAIETLTAIRDALA